MVGTKRGREGTGWSWPAGEVARLGADFPGILFASPDGTTLEGFLGMGRGRGNSQTNAKGSSLHDHHRVRLSGLPPLGLGPLGPVEEPHVVREPDPHNGLQHLCASSFGVKVEVCGALAAVLDAEGRADLARARLEESGGPHAFLLELRSVVDRAAFAAPTRTTSGLGLDLGSHLRLCAECRSWSCSPAGEGEGEGEGTARRPAPAAAFLAEANEVSLTAWDCRGVPHQASLRVPPSYPRAAPLLLHALPCEVGVREAEEPGDQGAGDSAARWVVGTLGAFDEAVGSLGGFFLAMAALDSACAVLEPELKRGGEDVAHRFNYRRISLGGRCACVVTFRDPRQAWPFTSETLEVVLVGPRAACEAMEASRAAFWRARARAEGGPSDLVEVLRQMLGREVPGPAAARGGEGDSGQEEGDECGVCYSALGAGDAERCPGCGRGFHRECLAEWFRSDPSTRRAFDTVFGRCPYCGETAKVKV